MLMLSGCGGAKNGKDKHNLQAVQLEHNLGTTQSREISIQMHLDSNNRMGSIPVNYYLVSQKEMTLKSFEKDNNETTLSEPVSQYCIGSDLINLNNNGVYKETNITISGDIPSGEYKLVAYIDPRNTENISSQNNAPIIEDSEAIDLKPIIKDVSLLSATLDDDVLLIDDDNLDAMLTATLSAKANVDSVNHLSLKACIALKDGCVALPFYNEDGSSSYSRPIKDLNEDITHISIALKIPKSLKKEWFNSLDNTIHNANIKITLVSQLPNEPLENNIQVVPLSIYKNSVTSKSNKTTNGNALLKGFTTENSITSKTKRAITTIPSSSGNILLKEYSKGFTTKKRDKRFGIKLSSNAYARFSTLDSDTGVKGGLSVRVLGHDISIFNVNLKAGVEYASFKNTGYSMLVRALHKNIFVRERNIYDTLQTTPPRAELEENEKKLPKEEQNKILTKRQIEINKDFESEFLLSYSKDFSVEKTISKKQQIMVAIVPVVVKAGAGGSIGFKASIGLDGILSLSSRIGPDASIGGFASGGVGVVGFSAGIEAEFTFVKNYFYADTNFSFLFSGDSEDLRLKGVLSEKIANTFKGPDGRLNLYAEYTLPKVCSKKVRYCVAINWQKQCTRHKTKITHYPCGVKTMHPTKNLFKWDSKLSKNTTLLEESQTLTNNKIY